MLTRRISGRRPRAAWGTAGDHCIESLFKSKAIPLLIDEGFLLDHQFGGQSSVHSHLLLQLTVQLFDLLVELTLIDAGLHSRVLLKLLQLLLQLFVLGF